MLPVELRGETERQRDRETEKHSYREKRDGETERQRDRRTYRHTYRQTDKSDRGPKIQKEKDRDIEQRYRQRDRQRHIHSEREIWCV